MFYWLFIWLPLLRQIDSEFLDLSMRDGWLNLQCRIEFNPELHLPNYISLSNVGFEHSIIEAHLVNATTWEAAHIDDRLSAQDVQEGLMLVGKNYGIGWCWFFSSCKMISETRSSLLINFETSYEIFFIHGGKYECKVVYPDSEYKTEISINGLLENLYI